MFKTVMMFMDVKSTPYFDTGAVVVMIDQAMNNLS